MADIELVTKIPEEMYKWINDVNKFLDDYGISDFIDLVKNGVPLPKGHGRLIDADALLTMTENYKDELGRLKADVFVKSGITTVEEYIKDILPTIIEADKAEDMMKNAVVIKRSLCDSCVTKGCIFQSGIVRNHCDFYKAESEGEK